MTDTASAITTLVTERRRAITPDERWRAAACLFETARAIVESSLPTGLSRQQLRLAVAHRLCGEELPVAAITAFATFDRGARGV